MGVWRNEMMAFLESGALNNLGRAAKSRRNQAVRRNNSARRVPQVIYSPGIRQGLYNYSRSQSQEDPSLAEALSACGQEIDAPLNAALLSAVDANSEYANDHPHCNLAEYIIIRDAVLAEQK